MKLKTTGNDYHIYCNPRYGPIFGNNGMDLCIFSNSNTSNSNSCLRYSYTSTPYQYESNEAKEFLAGSHNFMTSEIEVYQVV